MIKPSTIVLVVFSFALGWWGHTWVTLLRKTDINPIDNTRYHSSAIAIATPSSSKSSSYDNASTSQPSRNITRSENVLASENASATTTDPFADFTRLLNTRKYHEAMDILAEIERSFSEQAPRYRALAISTLKAYLEQNYSEDFTELSSLYLSTYFDDVDVLLLLARFNKETDFHIEAVNIFQLAREYAYSLKMRTRVEETFQDFIAEVDKDLTSRFDWYNLSQIYLQSDIVGLLKGRNKLRQAEVLVEIGDSYHAKQILQQLLEIPQWSDNAKELLAEINGGADSILQNNASSRYTSSIQLEKRGNQYLIPLLFSSQSQAKLLIDTGASMTTLSEDSFQRLSYGITYEELESRMFSTANGVTKGRVLKVEYLQLGEYQLENIMLAVLDFKMGGDVDGLLGMNLLGQFSFQIDQDEDLLLLTPR